MLITPIKAIFDTGKEDFDNRAIEIFKFQSANNLVYKNYLKLINVNPAHINDVNKIPFLPIDLFRSHIVTTKEQEYSKIFTSSGTTGSITSRHYIFDLHLYETSFQRAFEIFYGKSEQYCILALLPGYMERQGSSLIYMVEKLIQRSNHPNSGFYLNQYEQLVKMLKKLEEKKQKTLLIGVSYALLDLSEKIEFPLKHTTIIETGGMKGKRKEITKEELHSILKRGFGIDSIHSEYGMTELLSQAYSKQDRKFFCPPWMQVKIRDVYDPFCYNLNEQTGGINIIDLANIYSCSFIETRDLGKKYQDGSFEILGRFDNSDIRGCNLLVE